MNLRRRSLATAFALTVGGLAACTGATGPGAGPTDVADEGQTLTVYAAASLAGPISELLAQYAADHPEVAVAPAVFDGSATLVTQVTEGASPDVIATANEATMSPLTEADVVTEPEFFATNSLVIAVPEGNPADITSLADLAEVDTVLCAPEVPCGDSAATLLDLAGVELEPISLEQNVTAAAERVTSGAAGAALVYATDVAARADQLDAVVPDQAAEVVNRYPIAALTSASQAGTEFVELVRSADGAAVLAEHGFGAP
ncbi:molybdate ABC transporter substrate-binding protein [Ruania halotolerans]|uniref:molybdate ABC transporter substrate-binding protein n=1 Tax=Ruania halotolerans TaxID=2897773 RepID=UPI001E4D6394|nr:molybdate ABC transporter substrate-binding protein [Ruania halotolerans]UFU07239.1 molybdate ABC transporter substrate-binding protein [Ruania halotolerans]